jgi:hypothetical protein
VEEIPFSLREVQREVCHGEGKGHLGKKGIERKVTLGVCRNCHTKDQSPDFNYLPISKSLTAKSPIKLRIAECGI